MLLSFSCRLQPSRCCRLQPFVTPSSSLTFHRSVMVKEFGPLIEVKDRGREGLCFLKEDTVDPIFDPILWDTFNWLNGANSKEGPSQNYAETSNQARPETDNNHGNMRPLVVWPPESFLCSCCLVLRGIIHSNGYACTKLEMYGQFGMICHAIQQSTNASWYQMFDFCKKSLEDVKNFLVQYCDERTQAGFFFMPDPLSNFYGGICVGLDFVDNVTTNNYTQPNPATDDYTQPPGNKYKSK
ncbi:hypothetical protein Ddye_020176 [Dipteronia dyeriana]|uniref:Uncharacterized protein n=1 Tax=Dipteronia dyeriana TaxID=168575 RepID=A0AAD9TZA0_9ROSI|nr:hypothetical protein Ddye_020176 [Dipteronia dyeriana]